MQWKKSIINIQYKKKSVTINKTLTFAHRICAFMKSRWQLVLENWELFSDMRCHFPIFPVGESLLRHHMNAANVCSFITWFFFPRTSSVSASLRSCDSSNRINNKCRKQLRKLLQNLFAAEQMLSQIHVNKWNNHKGKKCISLWFSENILL